VLPCKQQTQYVGKTRFCWQLFSGTGASQVTTTQATYVQRNAEARSQWKSNKYETLLNVCLCPCLSHPARKAHAPYYIACGLLGSTIFFHIIPQTAGFSEKKVIENETCFDFLYFFRLKHF
jgi:hypothetical protein